MPSPPWLSVIIPTYNGERYLASCLQSIATQGVNTIECIAIDDGSTDRTLDILESFRKIIPLKIVKKERSGNWVVNTNIAMNMATGDFVCFLHQDDLWQKDRLRSLHSLISNFKEIGFFLNPSDFIDSSGKYLGHWRCPLSPLPQIITSELFIERLLVQNFIAIPAPVFKRKLALEVGGLDENFGYTADWDFWLKLGQKTDIAYCPEFLTSFRIHPASQTLNFSRNSGDFTRQLKTVFEKHLNSWQAPLSRKRRVEKSANFSILVNVCLGALAHGQRMGVLRLLLSFLSLGPLGWRRYLRDSRIVERVRARCKTSLFK